MVAIDSLPQASVAPASPRAPAASAAIAGPSEMSVLKEAQDALASDPARSLELTKTHERAFPRGGFAEEREVIRIDALMRLGRSTDARERAKAFYVRFPDSAHRARIEALLAK